MNKKKIKYIGNILTVIALLFLVKKMLDLDIDYSSLFTKEKTAYLIFFSLLYGFHIYTVCFSWKTIVKIITNKNIRFSKVSLILCKANLLKYIPGNVFQYVGRNELAIKENLKHTDVALSTVVDIFMNVAGVFLLAVLCYSSGVVLLVKEYGFSIFKILCLIVLALVIIIMIIHHFFKDKLYSLFSKVKIFFKKENFIRIIGCLIYYFFWGIYTGYIYIGVLIMVVGMDINFQQSIIILGAFLFSWILGFVMPGAPGGIGIREACLTLLLNTMGNIEPILFGIVIYRVINIIGDLLGLLFAKITVRVVERRIQ